MALSYPLDLMTDWPGWVTEFQIDWRQQHSRQANGIILTSVLGTPLWRMTATTGPLKPTVHKSFKALLSSLEEGRLQFYGRDLAGCYPTEYPGVNFTDTGTIDSIAVSRTQAQFDDLWANARLSRGDYFHVQSGANRSLHQLVEAITADGSGNTGTVEFRPYLPSWVTNGMTVKFRRAVCKMIVLPGSVSAPADPRTGIGTITFSGIQTF